MFLIAIEFCIISDEEKTFCWKPNKFVLCLESPDMTAFAEYSLRTSEGDTKTKAHQIDAENVKIRQLEPECLFSYWQCNFPPFGKVSDFQCTMGIIKLDIWSNTGLRRSIGRKVLSVELFFFSDAKNVSATVLSYGLPRWEKGCFVWCSRKNCWKRWERYCDP